MKNLMLNQVKSMNTVTRDNLVTKRQQDLNVTFLNRNSEAAYEIMTANPQEKFCAQLWISLFLL